MRRSKESNPLSKVYYRPIEAAIRWSGLTKHESQILGVLRDRQIPVADELANWPGLQLHLDRILDGIRNKELASGIAGTTVEGGTAIDHPQLSVRHVHLKSWMARFYDECRPEFLFGSPERSTQVVISVNAIHGSPVEREVLKAKLEDHPRDVHTSRAHRRARSDKQTSVIAGTNALDPTLGTRGEATYLNILGSLIRLVLGRTPSGNPYSSFRSQESIISAMVAEDGARLGISERTLEAKFAAARRAMAK